MKTRFLLATRAKRIELVCGAFEHIAVGDLFDRMPATEVESWTTLKVFEGAEEQKIRALADLLGFQELARLFKVG